MDSTETKQAPPRRVLLVADWELDPEAVVEAARNARAERPDTRLALLVPAWLHGIDWAGDPHASVPCAHLQVETIRRRCAEAGAALEWASVGDADPAAAMGDATSDWPADELLLFTRARRVRIGSPLDVAHRARRLTGLPVRRIDVRARPAAARRRTWLRLGAGHCAADAPQPA